MPEEPIGGHSPVTLLLLVLLLPLLPASSAHAAGVVELIASADTWTTASGLAAVPRGADTLLQVDASGPRRAFLSFDVDVPEGQVVTGATLRLRSADTAPAGVQVHRVTDTAFEEHVMTRGSEPALGDAIATLPALTVDVDVDVDLSAAVTAEGAVVVALASDDADDATFSSREGFSAPVLLVTHDAAPAGGGGGGSGGGGGGGSGGGGGFPPSPGADLGIALAADPAAVVVDGTTAVTATVTNAGPVVAEAVVAIDVPPHVESQAPPGCTSTTTRTMTCPLGAIDAGADAAVTISLVHPVAGADVVTATASSDLADPDPDDDVAEITIDVTPPSAGDPISIGGGGATEASLAVSRSRFGDAGRLERAGAEALARARWVVLARDDEFADSLAGSPLTADGPLLYTPSSSVPDPVRAEVDRVLGGAGTVFLLGGTAALGTGVEAAVRDAGYTTVRLAGPSRIETAIAIAREVQARLGDGPTAVARAFGVDGNPTAAWADSISAGGWAAERRARLLLSPSDALHPAVAAHLAAVATDEVVVLGGPAALSAAVEDGLSDPVRVAGAERGATAAAVATDLWGQPERDDRSYVLVNGYQEQAWVHGLLAAGVSADRDAPVLLSDRDTAPLATTRAVTDCSATVGLVHVGGPEQISSATLTDLDALDDPASCEPFATVQPGIVAAADTWTGGGLPAEPKGADVQLAVSGREDRTAYLRFDVDVPDGQVVAAATLQLRSTDTAPAGLQVHAISATGVSEDLVTADAPTVDGVPLATLDALAVGQDVQVDVTDAVAVDGAVAVVLTSDDPDDATFASRESSEPPLLVITTVPAVTTVLSADTGSSDPTALATNRRVAVTEGGRRLAVVGHHAQGLLLRWRDVADDGWSTTSTGDNSAGVVLSGTGTGDWSASIAIGDDGTGAEAAWVVWSRDSFATVDVRVRRLTDLDAVGGPTIGPAHTIASATKTKRPDVVYDGSGSSPRLGVVYSAQDVAGLTRVEVGFIESLLTDTPSLVDVHEVVAPVASGRRHGSFAATPHGLRLVVRGSGSSTRVLAYQPGATTSSLLAALPSLDSTAGVNAPNGVGFDDGGVAVVTQPDPAVDTVQLQHVAEDGTASERYELVGYREPVLTGDGASAVLVMVRASDGAVVSRAFAPDADTDAADDDDLAATDRVELAGGVTSGLAQWPAVPRRIDDVLDIVVRGSQGTTAQQHAVLALLRRLG